MWSPPKTGLLETRVPYRPFESRVVCSENEVVYTHGIHLKALETWFQKVKSSLGDSIFKLWWILIHVVFLWVSIPYISHLDPSSLFCGSLGYLAKKTSLHFCTFPLSLLYDPNTHIYTSSCQVRFL